MPIHWPKAGSMNEGTIPEQEPADPVMGEGSSRRYRDAIVNGRRTSKGIGKVLSERDLSVDDWLILGSLRETNGLTMSQLADETMMSPASLCRFVDKLTDKALLYRKPNPFDRRQLCVFISQRGADLLKQVTKRLDSVTAQTIILG